MSAQTLPAPESNSFAPLPEQRGTETILPGRYLVRVQTETAVHRSGLDVGLGALHQAHREQVALRDDAGTPAPLLSPGTFRRQFTRSEAFRTARQQTQRSLGDILDALSRHVGRSLHPTRTFDVVFGGFALELSAEEAERLATHPLVVRVDPERSWPLQSDVSPDVVMAPDVWTGTVTGTPARGAGVLVGVIDSGIEPTHPSFADVAGVANPLGSGNFLGVCDDEHPDYDEDFCSDKLVGAYDLTMGPEFSTDGPDDGSYTSHGSHVAGIAVGNEIDAGLGPNPEVPHLRGVAPLASVVAYDACYRASQYVDTCDTAAIIAAIAQAVLDGVDVLNISIRGATISPWSLNESTALLDAYEAGVLTVASAGNDGPGAGTVTRLEPWVLNVGATTHDRVDYLSVLSPSGGDEGTRPAFFPARGMGSAVPTAEIVVAGDIDPDNAQCDEPFADDVFDGKIVYCEFFGVGPLRFSHTKAEALANTGAVAMISSSFYPGWPLLPTTLPYFLVPDTIQADFENWLATSAALRGAPPTASLTAAALVRDGAYADIMMGFSSRGPATGYDLLKPDMVAPGANVLAPADSEHYAAMRYNSGTSMAAPAVAGAAALVREIHPALSPAEVQSILQSTAEPTTITSCSTAGPTWVPPCSVPDEPADLFDFGSGRLDVTAAAKAGLAFDVTRDEFFAANPNCDPDGIGPFPCDPAGPSQLNLASMAKEDCGAGCAFARRAGSIAAGPVHWSTSFLGPQDQPPPVGVEAHVVPAEWTIGPGTDQPFIVGVYPTDPGVVDEWQQLVLLLTPDVLGVSPARLPIVVMPTAQPASSDLEVTARVLTSPEVPGDTVQFEVTVRNLGTLPAVGVQVSADVLSGLDDRTWTCVPPARNWCGAGDGALLDRAAILPGDEVVYLFEGTAQDPLPDPIQLDAAIIAPAGLNDPAGGNDTASAYASTILFADDFESGNVLAWQ